MEILITNDDGWGAEGLNCLLRTVSSLGHLTILVPDRQRSGVSNAVTPSTPLYLKPIDTPDWLPSDATVYLTNGTPSDCVKMAINVLFGGDDSKINLLLSGINHGSNAAINLIYSGTMGAVFVGAEHNIPAIGFSIDDLSSEPDFSYFEPRKAPFPACVGQGRHARIGKMKCVRQKMNKEKRVIFWQVIWWTKNRKRLIPINMPSRTDLSAFNLAV